MSFYLFPDKGGYYIQQELVLQTFFMRTIQI